MPIPMEPVVYNNYGWCVRKREPVIVSWLIPDWFSYIVLPREGIAAELNESKGHTR